MDTIEARIHAFMEFIKVIIISCKGKCENAVKQICHTRIQLCNLPNGSNTRSGKQPSTTGIAAPEPIIVDILDLLDISTSWEKYLILDFFLGVIRPHGMYDETDATIGWKASEGRSMLRGRSPGSLIRSISSGAAAWGRLGASETRRLFAAFLAFLPAPVADADLRRSDGASGWG
jgi:hypothetical protein